MKIILSIMAAVMAGLLPAAALAQALPPRPPAPPLPMQLKIKPPQPDNWNVRVQGVGTVYVCKPLACPDQVQVTITTARSPTNTPNPQALEKLAKIDLPKRLKAMLAAASVLSDTEAKFETVTTKVTTLLGFPSIDDEMKITRGKNVTFNRLVIIFAGPLMITTSALSPNREVAVKTADEFVAGMQIDQHPSSPTAKPVLPSTSPI